MTYMLYINIIIAIILQKIESCNAIKNYLFQLLICFYLFHKKL